MLEKQKPNAVKFNFKFKSKYRAFIKCNRKVSQKLFHYCLDGHNSIEG